MTRQVVAVVNDIQVGGTTALMPKKVVLDDGGIIRPSKIQKSMLRFWNSSWEEVFEVAGNDELITILNGEPCDGDHHKTYQIWSRRMTDQKAAACELLLPIANRSNKLYCVRGTPAHSGTNFDADTEVARELGAVERIAFPKLRLNLQGNRFLFTHKGPSPGFRDWTWGDSIRRELRDLNYRSMRRGSKPIDYYVWAHFHQRAYEPYIAEHKGRERLMHGYVVPGWQLSTAYISSILKGEDIMSIGMLYFVIENGKVSHHWIVDTRDVTPEFTHE